MKYVRVDDKIHGNILNESDSPCIFLRRNVRWLVVHVLNLSTTSDVSSFREFGISS